MNDLYRVALDTVRAGRICLVRCADSPEQAQRDALNDVSIAKDHGTVLACTAIYLCTVDELVTGRVILQDNFIRRTA